MKKTSRRGFGKQLTCALGALPFAALAANTVGGQEKDKEKDKEKEKERKIDRPRADDTPIIVGGGGGGGLGGGTALVPSTYVWILQALVPRQTGLPEGALLPIDNPTPDYEVDGQDTYYCYELPVSLRKYRTHDGSAQGGPHDIKPEKRRKHRTKFHNR